MKRLSRFRPRSLGILFSLSIFMISGPLKAATIHVAPSGSDENPGTRSQAMASLSAARDAARSLSGRGHTILLAPGCYFNEEPIVLDERDSGLTIRGTEPGAVAEVYGGVPVKGWERWQGNIWRARVPKGERFYNLVANGRSLTMAQTPNAGSGYGGGAKSIGSPDTWRPREYVVVPEAWKQHDYSDAQVFAFHDSEWFSEMHAIVTPPDEKGKMKVTIGNIGKRLFIRGVLDFLDEPGEWCLKNKEGFVYYWPKKGTPNDQIVIRPTMEDLFVIKGRSSATPAKNITIENVSMIGTDFSEVWTPGKDNTSPSPRGMIFGENVEQLTVRNCRLLAAGHSAVFLNLYAQHCAVENNLIMEAGFAGVYMNGWPVFQGPTANVADSDVNKGHRIVSNFIYDCGKFVGNGCGIQFYQSGDNLVARNVVGQMPRYGISYKGLCYVTFGRGEAFGQKITWDNHWQFLHTRNNKIVANEIYSVCRNSHDFGAIEAWGPGRDNLWANNAIHDVDATLEWDGYGNILYADDHNHYLTMRNNILYFCKGGAVSTAFSMKSVRQTTENNLLADSSLGIICGLGHFREPTWGTIVRHNVFDMAPKNNRYNLNENNVKGATGGVLSALPPGEKGIIEIDYNAILPKDKNNPNPKPYPEYGVDPHSFFGDPLLRRAQPVWDVQYADYSLAPNSPAFDLGFKPIRTDVIGLRPDFQFDSAAAIRRMAADKIQAEGYQRMSGLRTEGGKGIFHISKGAWAKYANIDFGMGEAESAVVEMETTSAEGALLELRLDSPKGRLIGEFASGQSTCPLASASGIHNLFLVFPRSGVKSLDWFKMLLPAARESSSMASSPTRIANDGVSLATITVTLRNKRGNFVPGKTVKIKSKRGAIDKISPASAVSDEMGKATFKISSSKEGKAVLLAANMTDEFAVSQPCTVAFSPEAMSSARSSVEVSPSSLRAAGDSPATVTVKLRNGRGEPLAGKSLVLKQIAGETAPEIDAAKLLTDENGIAHFKIKSEKDDRFVFKVLNLTDGVDLKATAVIIFTPRNDATPEYSTRDDGYTVVKFKQGKGTWTVPEHVKNVELLVVGGGGGGGLQAGGAGAGGLYYVKNHPLTPSSPITVAVGTGGAPGGREDAAGKCGEDSVFGEIIAYGGAGTAGYHSITTDNRSNDFSDGGEQGGCFDGKRFHPGKRGGRTDNFDGQYDSGGGAGAPGSHGNRAVGGAGLELDIIGIAKYYAAGGGALESTVGAKSGAGHCTGGSFGSATYEPASENTGAGGQGGWGVPGNKGASGIVIVAYPPAEKL